MNRFVEITAHRAGEDLRPLPAARARSPSAPTPTSSSGTRRRARAQREDAAHAGRLLAVRGREVIGAPTHVLSRGKVVVENGKYLARKGAGGSCAAPPSRSKGHHEQRQRSRNLGQAHLRHLARAAGVEARSTSTSAEGCYFWDAAGKRYLDFSSQLICSNLGHQNQAVIDAICAQAAGARVHQPRAHLRRRAPSWRSKLLEVMPEGPRQVLLHHLRHRGQRGGHQDRPHVHRQAQDHRPLHLVPRLDRRLDRRHRRSAPLVRRARRQDPGRHLRRPRSTATAARSGRRYPECGVACADYLALHDRPRRERRRGHHRAHRRHQRRPRAAAGVPAAARRASPRSAACSSSPTR